MNSPFIREQSRTHRQKTSRRGGNRRRYLPPHPLPSSLRKRTPLHSNLSRQLPPPNKKQKPGPNSLKLSSQPSTFASSTKPHSGIVHVTKPNLQPMLNRRQLLKSSSCGFGSLALSSLLGKGSSAILSLQNLLSYQLALKGIIFLFMAGGPSHVDSFDYKPELIKRDGQSFDFVGVRKNTFGKKSQRKLLKPLWDFKQHGQSGRWVSSLFPHVAKHVDDLCFIHSMHTEGVAHGPSTLFLHTGATNLVRPSMGSWITYGLGTENENLPGFVTIMPSASKGGPRNYSNAFSPSCPPRHLHWPSRTSCIKSHHQKP